MKKIVTLYLEEALKDRSKELGINLSGFLERKLQEYIRVNDPGLPFVESNNQYGVTTTCKQNTDYSLPHQTQARI